MFEKSVSNGLHRASYGTLSLIAVLFSLLLIISGCGEEDDGGRGGNVTLSFTVPSAPPSGGAASKAVTPSGIGSISIAISGAGMTTITDTFNVSAGGTVTRSYTIPSGSSRTVTAKAYSGAMASGALLYQGSATFDLASGSAKTVAITMSSLFSLWAKTYGGTSDEVASSIQQTSDGGYIVAGWTASFGAGFRDSWILKLNADGTVAWQKTFGGIGIFDEVSSIQQTSDGGWIAAGVTDSSGAALTDIWIVKLFPDGTVDWQKRYGGSSREDVDVAIQQTADGGYIVGGHTQSFGRVFDDFWILKLDPIGNVTWQKTYGGTEDDRVTSIQQTTPDGGYIVAGWTKSFGAGPLGASDFWVLKLDRFGGVTWNQTYGGTGFEQPASIQQTADGGYIVAGYTSSFGAGFYDFWIVKLDNSGLVTWEKTYGGADYDIANSIQQTSDDGYIVAGRSGPFSGNYDLWALKLDATGTITWQKTYGGTSSDEAHSIRQTSDGGYIVAGTTSSFGAGSSDMWVLRLDSNGDIGSSCTAINTTSLTPSFTIDFSGATTNFTGPLDTTISGVPSTLTSTDTAITPATQCAGQ